MTRVGAMGTMIEDHTGGEGQLNALANSIVVVVAEPTGDWVYVEDYTTKEPGYIPVSKLRVQPESSKDGSESGSEPSRSGSNVDPHIPTGSISGPSIGAWSTSTYSQDSGLGGGDISGAYLKAAAAGDIHQLIELGSKLDNIDLAILTTARTLLNKPEMQGAKAIVDLAIENKKTQDKQGKAEHVSEINKRSPAVDEATKKNKNQEYLQAAIKGDPMALLLFKDSLNIIELDTLEMAQNILKNTNKEEAKAIVELAKKKKQDQDIKEKNEASKQVASKIGLMGISDDPAQRENGARDHNEEYLQAATKGNTVALASLGTGITLDFINLETIEIAQTILMKTDKDDAKAVVEFARKSKTVKNTLDKKEPNEAPKQDPIEAEQVKLSEAFSPPHDKSHGQKDDAKSKNDEYLQAAIDGNITVLKSFMLNLDLITHDTLEMAKGITSESGRDDTKKHVEIAIQLKGIAQPQVDDKSTEWLDAVMAGDSQTLTKLLASKSHITMETLTLARGIAKQRRNTQVIAITNFAFNERSKIENESADNGSFKED